MENLRPRYLQIAAYIMLGVIFIFAIGISKDCSRLPSAPRIGFSAGDTLDIALIYGPGSYYKYGEDFTGINHQIGEEFSKEAQVPVKFWPVNEAAEGMEKLQTGAFDILASLPLDNYIKERFPVSESVFLDRLVLVFLEDSVTGEKPVASTLDLNGKTVYVSPGSSAINRLQNLAEEIGGNISIEEVPDMSDELLTLQVASGERQLAVVNERVARDLARKYPHLKFDSTISFTQFQVWVFTPSDSIISLKFNDWFDTFRGTEAYREILNKF